MDKKFIKSMVAAIAGLTLVSSCSSMGSKEGHKCGGKNSCKGKMMEDSSKCAANKCSTKKADEAKKVESNTCGAANGCAAAAPKKSSKKK